jgi:hypothetical protein
MTRPWRSSFGGPRALLFLLAAAPACLFSFVPAPARAVDIFQEVGEEVNSIFEKTKGAVVQVESGRPAWSSPAPVSSSTTRGRS